MYEDPDRDAVTTALERLEGEVRELVRLHGGASMQTWAYSTADDGARRILRRRVPGESEVFETSIPLATEAALLRVAAARGVPVPSVVHVCGPGDGLDEAYVMTRVAGETNGRRIVADAAFAPARARLGKQCGRALAAIHAIPTDTLPPLESAGATETLARYEGIYRSGSRPRPIIEAAIRWLARTMPEPVEPRLVHADLRTGNLIIDPDAGLAAVIDWELAHLGDPAEDIGWLCVNSWRFGQVSHPVGGFAKLEVLLAAYGRAGGDVPDAGRLRWWQAMGSLKWAVVAMMMYRTFANGTSSSVERAVIGRRVSECEVDLLALMEQRR